MEDLGALGETLADLCNKLVLLCFSMVLKPLDVQFHESCVMVYLMGFEGLGRSV